MINKIFSIFISVLSTIVFVLVVTPTAIIFRVIGIDYLKLKSDRRISTYWEKKK